MMNVLVRIKARSIEYIEVVKTYIAEKTGLLTDDLVYSLWRGERLVAQ